MAVEECICVAYEGLDTGLWCPVPVIREIPGGHKRDQSGVAVVFSVSQATAAFFKEVIKMNMKLVWLASTQRGLYRAASLHCQAFRTIALRGSSLALPSRPPATSPLDKPYPCADCWKTFLSSANASIVDTEACAAHRIQRVRCHLQCGTRTAMRALDCRENRCFRHPQIQQSLSHGRLLQKALQKVSLDLNGAHIEFDKQGNPSIGYRYRVSYSLGGCRSAATSKRHISHGDTLHRPGNLPTDYLCDRVPRKSSSLPGEPARAWQLDSGAGLLVGFRWALWVVCAGMGPSLTRLRSQPGSGFPDTVPVLSCGACPELWPYAGFEWSPPLP
ncbi:hypothetical protein NFI96_030396 [Prochilodus magdalenae]|nr:hypothetical protein NFI96_030396 [Prochilodus magdalenae]